MRTFKMAAPLLGLALVLGACSASAATPPTSSTAAAPSTAASGAGAGVTIDLASTNLGTVLVGEAGRTLYVFTADSGGTSTCYDQCQATWPPVTSDTAPVLGSGLAAGDFGTSARTDGSTQVAFHGMPLYYFSGDTAAGDTNGQGINGKWFVVDANGQMVEQAASPSPTNNIGY